MLDGAWTPIVWKEEMSVGVAQLDDDHKGLISILNRLGTALHEEAESRANLFLRGLASPFNRAAEIWAPKYRQAHVGAFVTDKPEAEQAIDG